jgi:hypothetical protein
MRKAEEIKTEMAGLEMPAYESEAETKARLIVLEVLLDIRDLLDSIASMAVHIEGHAEALRREQ